MSTLTRTDSNSKHPQYRDYVSFLESYKNGKKDDENSVITNDSGVSFSLTNSSNNSSSSVFSDVSINDAPKSSFKEYLESLSQKKYNPVKPAFIKTSSEEKKVSLKSEVFIEIKNPKPPAHSTTKVFEVNVNEKPPNCKVNAMPQMFQQTTNNKVTLSPSNENKFKKNSVGEISKRFEEPKNTQNTEEIKVYTRKAPSISKMSKVFQDGSPVSNGVQKNIHINGEKPLLNGNISEIKVTSSLAPKPTITIAKSAVEKMNPKPVLPHVANGTISPKPDIRLPKPTIQIKKEKSNDNIIITSIPHNYQPPPPPPPPPMPATAVLGKTNPFKSSNILPPTKNTINGVRTTQDTVDNGKTPLEINKNDPRVKKLVYGALREMYGAYHDKANDYLSTLPKNRVRKNNGLDSIIDSIASQGGLDKLTGRVNPNAEKD